jgi:acyl-CoA reductase-like NAD-dependent aldehyde dehydrogenase
MTNELFTSIFPNEDMVPEKYRIVSPIEQRQYLCDGAMEEWTGPQQDVLSPICEAIDDTVRQKLIGTYPLLTEEQALKVLDAACRAYDHGRGSWPTMSVEERIGHVEAFVYRMKEQREEIVKLLMWEIGKTLPDAEKEFDRTVAYIRDTIDAVKDLDRISSRFVICSLFGSNAEVIADLIDPMVNQVCRVNINSQCQRGPDVFPFTGRKDSAEGALSVSDALRVFTIRTLVAAKETDANRRIIKSIVTERRSRFLSTDFIL